jgi:hypothetical protein
MAKKPVKKELPAPTDEQIQFIKTEYAAIIETGRKGLDHAIACGEALRNIQKNTKHGKWEDWVEGVACIPKRTASRYMGLADNQVELQKAADAGFNFGVRNALEVLEEYKLSLLSPEDKAAADAKQKAEQAKKDAEQAEKDAEAAKAKKAEVEAEAKKLVELKLVPPSAPPAPTTDLKSVLEGKPHDQICVDLCTSMELEDLFKLASGIVKTVLGRTDITMEQWRLYKKGLADILAAAKTPEAEPLKKTGTR